MSCNCIEDLEQKILHKFNNDGQHKGKVKSARIHQALLFGKQTIARTYCKVDLTIEGRKSKVQTDLIHSYCPFCGKKLEAIGTEDN